MICYYPTEHDRRTQRRQERYIIPKPNGSSCDYHTECKTIHCHANNKRCVNAGCVKAGNYI